MYTFRKQSVAVIGATGQVGTPLTKGLLSLGHDVVVLTRNLAGESAEKLNSYKAEGALLVEVRDMLNVDDMAKALEGVDTLICAVPGSKQIITDAEPLWLEAAVKAGVKRFVPTEFGCHTRNLDYGDGVIFDYKKRLHNKIIESGIGWTFFYNGGIFDYFLPNLRFFRKITTFG
ncbi:NmrA family NAD(P)-binding protein, partial [Photobacterium sagamiensis]|uniref:NmrA family NAD(P)-binding protein n=1 Tax=Photobacterium sagamiensis TaxID=2910241 RepID=UPI003D147161